MNFMKKAVVLCSLMIIPYVLLVYTERMPPAVQPLKWFTIFVPDDQTINEKVWFHTNPPTPNIKPDTNRSSTVNFKSSTSTNSQSLTNRSLGGNSESSSNGSIVLNFKLSTHRIWRGLEEFRFPANQSQVLDLKPSIRPNMDLKPLTNKNKSLNQKSQKKTISGRNKFVTKTRKPTKTMMKKKFLIYACTKDICGGLGDRQAGIVSTYLLAKLTHRNFDLIMTKPCDVRQYLYPSQVEWDIPRKRYNKLTSETVKWLTRKTMRSASSLNFNQKYRADVVYLETNYILYDLLRLNKNYRKQLGWLSNTTYTQFFYETYRKIFKPSDMIARKLETFLGRSRGKNNTKLVCAQIRLGRNPTFPGDDIRNNRSSVKVVWDFLRRYNDSRRYKIFVTTDSEEVRNESTRLFPDQIMDTDGKIIHLDVKQKQSAPVCKGMEKVFLDQYILANCDVLVHSRSGFGENAARLKEDRREIYVFRNGHISPSYIIQ